ncbi:MAG: [FeFe] hydrogenase H-cluster maturation GTPase HydF [Ruminococcaceae bacterium]|nr:[FeFe] hydrogenase H-cluster maturation GTPase HydF [Oscillospiraceae bacterium]
MAAALTDTPSALRLTIGVFGRTNSGKSSLINALCGQMVSLVSEEAGTTTDPVAKAIEIYPLGPCTLIDTAGFGDDTKLGKMRMERTREVMEKTDLAILVISAEQPDVAEEKRITEALQEANIPIVAVLNKTDAVQNPQKNLTEIKEQLGLGAIPLSLLQGTGLDALREEMIKKAPESLENPSLTGHLAKEGDKVLLVMPQDRQAPKGRLILPQVQVIRDLLDIGALVTCVTPAQYEKALSISTPDVIITDSQVFPAVYAKKPAESVLTSFSVLLARAKGDIEIYHKGAKAVHSLKPGDKVLIAEACSHQPLDGDIGRIKIPQLLHTKVHPDIEVTVTSGNDFPNDLTPYALVIHCGGCMFGRRQILSRVSRAVRQGVPITNYGIFLAEMAGILDTITL